MPTLTIYRSRRSIGRDFAAGRWTMEWDEFHYDPRPAVAWGAAGWAHIRSAPEPVRVRVPPGELRPADAAAVFYLAARGEDGFRLLEGTEVARRKSDGGPMLFRDDDAAPAVGAYGPPSRGRENLTGPGCQVMAPDPAALRPVVAELAAQVLGPTLDAVRRALDQVEAAIADPDGDGGRIVTVRAILTGVLEDAGRPAAGGTEAA